MEKIELNNLSNKEIGYLIGLFYGDGYANYNKKDRHYNVEFYLHSERDKDIEIFLISLLKKLRLIFSVFKDKRFNCNRIRVHSKELYNFINLDKFYENDDFNLGFISGLVDSDGYVNLKKSTIQIINKNVKLLQKCRKILKKLDIDSNLVKKFKYFDDKNQIYYLSISIKFKRLKHISKKAGRLYHS